MVYKQFTNNNYSTHKRFRPFKLLFKMKKWPTHYVTTDLWFERKNMNSYKQQVETSSSESIKGT